MPAEPLLIGLAPVVEDPLQEFRELLALARTQRGKQLVLDGGRDGVEVPKVASPGRCDRDHVASPVCCVDTSFDQMLRREVVDERDHVAAVVAATAAEVGLARGPVVVERGQDGVLGAIRVGGRETVGPESLGPKRGLTEQPARQASQAPRRGAFCGFDALHAIKTCWSRQQILSLAEPTSI
jgi:hypothetical protein